MNDIVKKDDRQVAVSQPESTSILQIIERAALNPEVDMDKMERLLEMKERLDAKQAETDFNLAMNHAQSQTTRISADSNNPQTRSRYASYAALDRVLRPIYTENGFSLSFDTGKSTSENQILIMCYVSHKNGHTRTYSVPMDASGKGAKGGDVMTKTHAAGSAMSYGMRYLLKLIFNVAIGEDDTDGNMPVEHITEEMVNILDSKLEENEIDRAKFNAWLKRDLKVDSLEQVSMKAYRTVEARINSAIRAKQKEAEK